MSWIIGSFVSHTKMADKHLELTLTVILIIIVISIEFPILMTHARIIACGSHDFSVIFTYTSDAHAAYGIWMEWWTANHEHSRFLASHYYYLDQKWKEILRTHVHLYISFLLQFSRISVARIEERKKCSQLHEWAVIGPLIELTYHTNAHRFNQIWMNSFRNAATRPPRNRIHNLIYYYCRALLCCLLCLGVSANFI